MGMRPVHLKLTLETPESWNAKNGTYLDDPVPVRVPDGLDRRNPSVSHSRTKHTFNTYIQVDPVSLPEQALSQSIALFQKSKCGKTTESGRGSPYLQHFHRPRC